MNLQIAATLGRRVAAIGPVPSARPLNAPSPASRPGGCFPKKAGRYRAPITKYAEMLTAVTGLYFFSNYYKPLMNKLPDLRIRRYM
jgi:hypothetical protein